jgi:hypothetical protein
MRTWLVGFGVVSVAAGIIAACVGDDPSTGTATNGDGGNASSSGGSSGGSSGTPVDGSSGGDSSTDAGVDPCANVDLDVDAKNCGACGHDCMHGECSSGVCQPWVLTTVDGGTLYGPGTNGTHVFYSINGTVFRIQPDGGAAVQMTTSLDARAFAPGPNGMLACGTLALDAGVYQLPTNPGTAPTKTHDVAACTALTADGTTVWAGRLQTMDEITPTATRSHSIAVFQERMTGGIAAGKTNVFWVNQNNGVWNAPKAMPDAGRGTLDAGTINEPNGVAVDDTHAFVTARPAGAGGILLRIALDGGASETLLTNIPQATTQQHVTKAPNGALYFAAGSTLYGFVPPP